MELARLHLKLSGQTQNTVVKNNVTPAQLALYAFMHGEDCVQSLTVTGVDKNRTVHQEMQRLRFEFSSEHAEKSLNNLFPGMAPALPVTFRSIGYDPEVLAEEGGASAVNLPPVANTAAAEKLREKIAKGAQDRASLSPAATAPVHKSDLTGALDDTGDDEDDDLELSDDPLDEELERLQEEGEDLPDVPQAAQGE